MTDEQPDALDRALEQWAVERPDLDLAAMATLSRLSHLVHVVLGPRGDQVVARHGIQQGEFDVLATLRRSGAPFTMTPSRLSDELMMSRAGMTKRVDHLVTLGFVERSLDPEDRRSFHVALTGRGREVVDAAFTDLVGDLSDLLAVLSPGQCAALDDALRRLMTAHSRR